MTGSLNASLDKNGITGVITTDVRGDATLHVMWPSGAFWSDGNLSVSSATMTGKVKLSKGANGGRLSGEDIKFKSTSTDESDTFSFDVAI